LPRRFAPRNDGSTIGFGFSKDIILSESRFSGFKNQQD